MADPGQMCIGEWLCIPASCVSLAGGRRFLGNRGPFPLSIRGFGEAGIGQSQASSPWVFLGMALPGNVLAGWVRWGLGYQSPRVWMPLLVTT